ncbi:MAG: septum formation initiator family protein [candidate division KSB1 bacterium]|nr:septum formation initiator family protein [candidate division KSB1 bacterium]
MRHRFWSFLVRLLTNPRTWLAIGIGLVIYSFVFERAGFINQARLKHENIVLQKQLEEAQARMKALQAEIDALRSDVRRLKEEAIRNGYAEPDEVIVRIQ